MIYTQVGGIRKISRCTQNTKFLRNSQINYVLYIFNLIKNYVNIFFVSLRFINLKYNDMDKLYFWALIAFLVINACSDATHETGLNDFQDDGIVYAKVENASTYSNIVDVKLMGFDRNLDENVELARGEWKDGEFEIELPSTLTKNFLYGLINNNGLPSTIINVQPTLHVSNKNVLLTNVEFWGVDIDDKLVTRFYPFMIYEDGNAEKAICTYVDSDVTISGYTETEVAITEYDEGKNMNIWYLWGKNTSYSIKWGKGWNLWNLSSSKSATERTITEQWSTTPFSGLKWYLEEDSNYL